MSDHTATEEPTGAERGTGEGDGPGPSAPAESRTGFRIAVVLAVAFASLSVFLAVVAAGLKGDLDEERTVTAAELDDRETVARTAGSFSEALLSYRFDDLDRARDRVLALSTGAFATEYEAAFAGLSQMIGEARSEARATVKDIFVGDIGDGRAEAITVVDADVEGTAGSRDVLDAYIRLVLVRVDGKWLVDGVTSLNFTPSPAPAGPAPPATEGPG